MGEEGWIRTFTRLCTLRPQTVLNWTWTTDHDLRKTNPVWLCLASMTPALGWFPWVHLKFKPVRTYLNLAIQKLWKLDRLPRDLGPKISIRLLWDQKSWAESVDYLNLAIQILWKQHHGSARTWAWLGSVRFIGVFAEHLLDILFWDCRSWKSKPFDVDFYIQKTGGNKVTATPVYINNAKIADLVKLRSSKWVYDLSTLLQDFYDRYRNHSNLIQCLIIQPLRN
jgi:hypothetical protein